MVEGLIAGGSWRGWDIFPQGVNRGGTFPLALGGLKSAAQPLALNLGPPNTIKEYQEAKTAIGDSLVFFWGGRDGIGHIQSICKVGKGRRG